MQTSILVQIAGSAAAAALYFLPAIVADRRRRHDKLTIALFNALLGWTIIGWLLTLTWAMQPNPPGDIASEVRLKRRALSMKAFSTGLVERVQRRIATQQR
ncbi:superinfection immunity protein [Burkholderia sp. TSV86]|uniref:superinfection immunity protein n=1 Tax=Burkholderia sp. TSV86 TaxID=1385594 RepID=UPI000757AF33|nr:superinfection immunity protein [Burkholderia sp. TSV86]KVE32502.1 immunity protein [Burkholderia sp. TSV86]